MVSDDVQKILKLYQQKGYYNAEVTSKMDFPKDPRKAVVIFNIDEKNKVYIKSINFTGNKNIVRAKTARSDADKGEEHTLARDRQGYSPKRDP